MPPGTVVPTDGFSPDDLIVPERDPRLRPTKVVMRLRYDYSALKSDDLYSARELYEELGGLREALSSVGAPAVGRAVRDLSAEELWGFEETARVGYPGFDAPTDAWRSLTQYWRVDMSERSEEIPALLERLRALSEVVEVAYVEGRLQDATLVVFSDDPAAHAPTGNDDPLGWQAYLGPADIGVDAYHAWAFTKGAGVGLVDLEAQWFTNHEDLDVVDPNTLAVTTFDVAVPKLYGDNAILPNESAFNGSHGASVWGVIFGRDNAVGGVGIAPGLERPARVSYRKFRADNPAALDIENYYFVEALLKAIREHAQPGDVLLIEAELVSGDVFNGGPGLVEINSPVETQPLERDAIQLAVSLGIIVVEAAGNGGANLDDTSLYWGDAFKEGQAGFEDSGAILVGASVPPSHSEKLEQSNHGRRVNCFAWGSNVLAPGSLNVALDYHRSYITSFGGTSAASAIIAGVAVLVQSYYKAQTGNLLSPMAMRALLSDSANGLNRRADQANPALALGIGVMPDLKKLLDAAVVRADVFLRDNLADTGVVPSSGFLSSSPDIIVRRTAVADPNGTFGETSPNRDRVDLSQDVVAGQDHYVYVRMMNRGDSVASTSRARVFYSPPATLVTPDLWTEIGTTNAMSVPTGGALTVSDGLLWPAAKLPAPGHYCFVALLDDPTDPAPPIPLIDPALPLTWDDFRGFIRNNNNVAWRNFNVVTSLGGFLGRVGQLPFLVVGAPGEKYLTFGLEVLQHLPRGSRVWVHLSPEIRGRWKAEKAWFGLSRRLTGWLPLDARRAVDLGSFHLEPGARYACRLAVALPGDYAMAGARVVVRQTYKGEEVGRVTWQFGAAKI